MSNVDKSQSFITLVRVGYAARGITYMLLGYLALTTGSKAEGGAKSAYDYIDQVPLGTPILYLMAFGLLAYALFKLASGVADLQHRGHDTMGIAKRVGDIGSCVVYLTLSFAAFQFANGTRETASGNSQEMAQSILTWQVGDIVIGLIGSGLIAAAAMQAKQAITAGFMDRISSRAPTWIEPLGRAGSAARTVTFGLIGWSLIKSAWLDSSAQVKGLGEALLSLRDMGIIYALVACGLILFGLFSLIVSRYRIIPDFDASGLKPRFRA